MFIYPLSMITYKEPEKIISQWTKAMLTVLLYEYTEQACNGQQVALSAIMDCDFKHLHGLMGDISEGAGRGWCLPWSFPHLENIHNMKVAWKNTFCTQNQ